MRASAANCLLRLAGYLPDAFHFLIPARHNREMAKRDNHYERAFAEYLRGRRVPCVGVDEVRRSQAPDGPLKSLDYIVSPPEADRAWLVDVKGRRFPAGRSRQYWKNWSTSEDLRGLARWEVLFGQRFHGLLVFAYHLVSDLAPVPPEAIFAWQDRLYAFVGIRLDLYTAWAHTISPRWDTVAMPSARFRELAAPLDHFLSPQLLATPSQSERACIG
jgi:hypothetical protein